MEEQLFVEGIAVNEGISRNRIKYTASELTKFAPTLKGRPILLDHNATTENVIGIITESEAINNGKSVKYKGWIKGEKLIEKIKDGRLKEVSIGALSEKIIKENEDDDFSIAEGLTGVELSIVPVPGVLNTSIKHLQDYTHENIKAMIDEYDNYNNERRVNKMENTNEKIIQEAEVAKVEEVKVVEKSAEVLALESKLKVTEDALNVCKEELKVANEKLAAIEESKRVEACKLYGEMAKAKGLNAVDTSKMTMEMVKVLMEAIKDVKVLEAKVEAVAVKEVKEEAKIVEEVKEIAETKSAVVIEAKVEAKEKSNYVIEESTLGGSCFYKIN